MLVESNIGRGLEIECFEHFAATVFDVARSYRMQHLKNLWISRYGVHHAGV
jgi:hypothetical protein